MTRDRSPKPAARSTAIVAGLAGLAIGWTLGALVVPEPALSTPAHDDDRELVATVQELTREMAAMRTRGELLEGRLLQELEGLRVGQGSSAPTPLITDGDGGAAEPAPPWVADLNARLDALRMLQREALAADSNSPASPLADWTIPAGVGVRDYLGAMHERANGSDDVTAAHMFWTDQRVRSTYGQPDRVEDRGDYVEWIYDLPAEGQQFDFHLVNGLCVMAH